MGNSVSPTPAVATHNERKHTVQSVDFSEDTLKVSNKLVTNFALKPTPFPRSRRPHRAYVLNPKNTVADATGRNQRPQDTY